MFSRWSKWATAAAVVVLLVGCSSSGHSDTRAINDAKSACADLVAVGQALSGASTTKGVNGSSIQEALEHSKSAADDAAKFDATHYKLFSQNIDTFVASIESGKQTSENLDTAVSDQCQGYN